MADQLPDLKAGVYRHYKGDFYLVLGYAQDANAEDLAPAEHMQFTGQPLGERTVVVYVPLYESVGPRMAVRTAADFHAWLHQDDGSICLTHVGDDNHFCFCDGGQEQSGTVQRFDYVGPGLTEGHITRV